MTIFEKIGKIKRDVMLHPKAKDAIRSAIVRHMIMNPVNAAVPAYSFWRSVSDMVFKKLAPIYAAAAIVVLLSGAVSFAAEGTLPGDMLYPVKVNVNESVRAALTFSPEAETAWEIERAERRLEETVVLSERGPVDADVEAKLEDRFNKHAERVREQIKDMETSGKVGTAANLASRFEISLKEHDAVFEKMAAKEADGKNDAVSMVLLQATSVDSGAAKNDEARKETSSVSEGRRKTIAPAASLGAKVRGELEEITKVRVKLEGKIESSVPQEVADIRPAAEGKVGSALNVIASVRSYIELKRSQGALGVDSAEEKLKTAEDLVNQAKIKLGAGFFGEAFMLASRASRAARDAQTALEFGGGDDDKNASSTTSSTDDSGGDGEESGGSGHGGGWNNSRIQIQME